MFQIQNSSDSDIVLDTPDERLLRDGHSSPVSGPSRSSSPIAGPSRPRGSSPVAGPSRPRGSSPTPGPSRRLPTVPASNFEQFSDSSSDSDFDPIEKGWNYKNQKRRKVPYRSMNFPNREEDSDSADYTSYVPSSPKASADPEVVFENNSFLVRLKKIGHSKQSRFNYSDHLYDLTFEVKKETDKFLLRQLFELLQSALTNAIEDLRSHYDQNYRNQIYTTILQSGLLNGLNSGGYSLATPPKRISDHMLNMLESYLQSHENLTLDKSFKVQFKILSVQHVTHRILNDPNYIVHLHESEMPGNGDKTHFPEYVYNFSTYCWEHMDICFHNLCFYLCLILSLARYDYSLKTDLTTYPEILTCQSRKDNTGCQLIHTLITKLKSSFPNYSWERMLRAISAEKTVQFHFFDADLDYRFVESYPSQFSFSLRPIYFCYFRNREHLTLILDYSKFCSKNAKYFCFSCGKYFKSKKSFQHRCYKVNTCFACCRPVYQVSYVEHFEDQFCKSESAKPSEEKYENCAKCNLTTKTELCFKFHKKVCSQGAKFDCCDTFLYNSAFSSQKLLKENHKCSEKKCQFCHAHYYHNLGPSHQCKFQAYQPMEGFPTLAFIHVLFSNSCGLDCYLCSVGKCNFHGLIDHKLEREAVHCTLYAPKSDNCFEVSHFSKYNKSHLNYETIYLKERQVYNSYQLTSEPKLEQLETRDEKSLTLCEQILRYIMDQKLYGLTFLCFCDSGASMIFIVSIFLANGLVPKIINKNSSILLVSVPDLKLRFLNLANFLPFDKLSEFPNPPFFPENFIHELSIRHGLSLTPEMFFCLSDSSELRQSKLDYSRTVEYQNWSFYKELIQFTSKCIHAFIHQTYQFIAEARKFQKFAFNYYDKEYRFLHPFGDNVSKNGYVFHLFQYLDFNDRDIYAISREYTGVYDRVSTPEMEYVHFLQFKNPLAELTHAWSPYGQKRFKSTIPDCIDESNGIAYFFMGCYYHSHPKNVCTLKKPQCTDDKSQKKHEEFTEKIKKLREEWKELKTVIVQWECDWKSKRKTGEVRDFLQNHFVKRPSRRLIPREASEYISNLCLRNGREQWKLIHLKKD